MALHIKLFEERFGYLPATILADKIYMNTDNRKLLKEYEINTYSKPLGRPPKKERPPEYYRKMAKASGTETKSNAPLAPAREYTEPTT